MKKILAIVGVILVMCLFMYASAESKAEEEPAVAMYNAVGAEKSVKAEVTTSEEEENEGIVLRGSSGGGPLATNGDHKSFAERDTNTKFEDENELGTDGDSLSIEFNEVMSEEENVTYEKISVLDEDKLVVFEVEEPEPEEEVEEEKPEEPEEEQDAANEPVGEREPVDLREILKSDNFLLPTQEDGKKKIGGKFVSEKFRGKTV